MFGGQRSHSVDYRTAPFVMGAIGRWKRGDLRAMKRAAGYPLTAVLDEPHAALLASGPVTAWQGNGARGAFWTSYADGPLPATWTQASQERLAAGLAVDNDRAWLHNCGHGLENVFTRRVGDALYFCSRIDPLTAIGRDSLTADFEAWSSILTLGSPLGEATPYVEVRRVPAATASTWTGTSLSRETYTPRWVDVEFDESVGPVDIIDVLNATYPRDVSTVNVPLTGGWDSRLLAGAFKNRGFEVRGWTTTADNGSDVDLALAIPVAEALGIEHIIDMPEDEQWACEIDAHRQRMEFQTWYHVGLMPLARRLSATQGPVLDGLAGDILIKGLWGGEEFLGAEDHQTKLWHVLGGWRGESTRLSDGARAAVSDASRNAFRAGADPWAQHQSDLVMMILRNRTTQVTALSPTLVFGPESDVRVPFLHPDVISTCLKVRPDRRLDGVVYRAVLESELGAPGLLPSTNDKDVKGTKVPTTQTTPRAIDYMLRQIAASDIAPRLLVPDVATAILHPKTGQVPMSAAVHLLQAVSMLAAWEQSTRRSVRFDDWPIAH